MTDHKARQAGLLDLINAYGRACRRDGSPAWESEEGQALHQFLAAHSAPARNGEGVWQPIETAPKDGTFMDLWIGGEFPRREPDCYWGLPDHCCGEMGSLCDSDWHGLDKGWVGSYNMPISDFDGGPTHWMPLPPPPATTAKDQS